MEYTSSMMNDGNLIKWIYSISIAIANLNWSFNRCLTSFGCIEFVIFVTHIVRTAVYLEVWLIAFFITPTCYFAVGRELCRFRQASENDGVCDGGTFIGLYNNDERVCVCVCICARVQTRSEDSIDISKIERERDSILFSCMCVFVEKNNDFNFCYLCDDSTMKNGVHEREHVNARLFRVPIWARSLSGIH